MNARDFEAVIERELRMYPVTFRFARFKRHPSVEVRAVGPRGGSFEMPFPGSASDWRAVRNCRSELRRRLRRIGIDRLQE